MSAPVVSIIVPAYRAASFLPDAVARLEKLDLTDAFEVLIVEDGSGDDTAGVAVDLASEYPRVRAIVLSENAGVAAARRRGVAEAAGEYVWFVDADDAWPAHALRTLLDLARRERADVAVAGAAFVYQDGRRRALPAPDVPPLAGREAFRLLLRGAITGHLWNKLFRHDLMTKVSFAPARVQSDLIMTADALARADRVAFTSETVYEYRLRAGSVITSTSKRAESLAIIECAITADADLLGLSGTDDHRYFLARYIQLSGIKDALLAEYDASERRAHLSARRRALTVSDLLLFARRADGRRFALGLSAKASLRAHRALLALAER